MTNIAERLHRLMLRPGFQAKDEQQTLLDGIQEIERLRADAKSYANVMLSEENDHLIEENKRLRATLTELRLNAVLLQQNAVVCATNHRGYDCELNGLPGWLTDTKASIDRATAVLNQQDALP